MELCLRRLLVVAAMVDSGNAGGVLLEVVIAGEMSHYVAYGLCT